MAVRYRCFQCCTGCIPSLLVLCLEDFFLQHSCSRSSESNGSSRMGGIPQVVKLCQTWLLTAVLCQGPSRVHSLAWTKRLGNFESLQIIHQNPIDWISIKYCCNSAGSNALLSTSWRKFITQTIQLDVGEGTDHLASRTGREEVELRRWSATPPSRALDDI